jgi:hypothetical protein
MFAMTFDSGFPPQHLEARLPNLYFTRFDILRIQTFIEIEFRFLMSQTNPSPEFIFSRLLKAIQAQGRVNTQVSVDIEDEWKFFLSDHGRECIRELEGKEREVFVSSRDGLGLFSDLEVKSFYRGFHDSFAAWKKKASDKMWQRFRSKGNDRSQTWKLLKRIRGTSRAVPIEPGKLLEHFRSIFCRFSTRLCIISQSLVPFWRQTITFLMIFQCLNYKLLSIT